MSQVRPHQWTGARAESLSSSSLVLQFGTWKRPDWSWFFLEHSGDWNQKRKLRHKASNWTGQQGEDPTCTLAVQDCSQRM